jgi:hypothetical protein
MAGLFSIKLRIAPARSIGDASCKRQKCSQAVCKNEKPIFSEELTAFAAMTTGI